MVINIVSISKINDKKISAYNAIHFPWIYPMMTAQQWGMSKQLSEMTCSRDTQNLVFKIIYTRAPPPRFKSLLHLDSTTRHRVYDLFTTEIVSIEQEVLFIFCCFYCIFNYLHTWDGIRFLLCIILFYFCLCIIVFIMRHHNIYDTVSTSWGCVHYNLFCCIPCPCLKHSYV